MSARVMAAIVGVVAAGLLLTGCAPHEVPFAEPADGVACSSDAVPGRIPDGFGPVAVNTCDSLGWFEDETGQWSATTQRRLEGDLDPLVAAFQVGDDWRWPGPCPAIGFVGPEVWLVDAEGSAIRVAYPVTGCGQPKAAAINAALEKLTVVDEQHLEAQMQESWPALDAGCPTRGEALRIVTPIEVEAPRRGEVDPSPLPNTIPVSALPDPAQVAGMRLCLYDADPLPAGEGGLVGLPVSGTFTASGELSREEALVVLANADYDVMPLIGCVAGADRYAFLHFLDGSGTMLGLPVQVELDHCQRLSTGAGFTLATPAVLDLVAVRTQPGSG